MIVLQKKCQIERSQRKVQKIRQNERSIKKDRNFTPFDLTIFFVCQLNFVCPSSIDEFFVHYIDSFRFDNFLGNQLIFWPHSI